MHRRVAAAVAPIAGTGLTAGFRPAESQTFPGTSVPSMAAALQSMPDSPARFKVLSDTFRADLDSYDTLNPARFSPIVTTLMIGGAVIALSGVWVLGVREDGSTPPERFVEKASEPVATA